MSAFGPDSREVDVELTRAPGPRSARTLQRHAASGALMRVRAGAFVDPAAWQGGSSLEQHRARIRAVVATRADRAVLTHESAAAVWGIPKLGRWPEGVHLADLVSSRPRSRNGIVWHQSCITESEIVEVDGYLVTDLTRTLVDLARTTGFLSAVVSLDHGVHPRVMLPSGAYRAGTDHRTLLQRLDDLPSSRGAAKARRAISFADPGGDSPGESLSRGQMHLLGFPPPRLQVRLARPDGSADIVDFDWPEHGLFGEFDGHGKYVRDQYTRGRTTADIVIAEKEREDRIRLLHRPRGVRWDWKVALDARRLAARLTDAGLPRSEPRSERRRP